MFEMTSILYTALAFALALFFLFIVWLFIFAFLGLAVWLKIRFETNRNNFRRTHVRPQTAPHPSAAPRAPWRRR